MNIEDILKRDGEGGLADFTKILIKLEKDPIERHVDTWQDEFDGKHEILNRANKEVGEGGNKKTVIVAKEVITFQKKVVRAAVAFLFGEPVKLVLNDGDDETFGLITDVWKNNKLDYFNKKLARRTFIETKTAELWYVIKPKDEESKIKVTLLSKKSGDDFWVHFDDYGDMDAFTRKYSNMDADGKKRTHYVIYTADLIINAVKKSGKWDVTEQENIFGKIPVIYYEQEKPEWADVQTLIDRIEDSLSKFADTNDYFGSPILKYKGKPEDLPAKEEVGKVLRFTGQVDNNGVIRYEGDAEYLTWEQGPESTELEYNILKDLIFSMTSTPDLSFNNVKGLSALSGIALKLMFSDSIMKAKDKEELFGENMIRRINLLKAILSKTVLENESKLEDLDISVEFSSPLPTDIDELVKSLSLARGGEAIMSEETAIRQNPLVTDADEDILKLKTEKSTESSFNLGGSYEV